MSYLDTASGQVVAQQTGEIRAAFIRKTYAHVALALVVLAVVEYFLLSIGLGKTLFGYIQSFNFLNLGMFFLFMGASVLANKWAYGGATRELQYAGLGFYILAFAIFISPLMYVANAYFPGVITKAAWLTAALVTALTAVVFTTRKDFSFLRPALTIGFVLIVAVFVLSYFFGFELGTFSFAAFVAFSAACILYTTSNVMLHYNEQQHVAASLALVSSIGMMFVYLVQFLMSFGSD
jgi:Integral membrane protein, interacts with FtsH